MMMTMMYSQDALWTLLYIRQKLAYFCQPTQVRTQPLLSVPSMLIKRLIKTWSQVHNFETLTAQSRIMIGRCIVQSGSWEFVLGMVETYTTVHAGTTASRQRHVMSLHFGKWLRNCITETWSQWMTNRKSYVVYQMVKTSCQRSMQQLPKTCKIFVVSILRSPAVWWRHRKSEPHHVYILIFKSATRSIQ